MGACIASEGVGIDMRRCNSGLFFLLSTCWVAVSTILVCATCGGGVSAPWTSWVQSGRKQQANMRPSFVHSEDVLSGTVQRSKILHSRAPSCQHDNLTPSLIMLQISRSLQNLIREIQLRS
ncbi:hypothetical protein BU26DRAFT_11874 [Trematosphaeria pertusa]|uniref:Uncharacterized protein n=1 Tax=Trematosphaeria pertusa TaxID=390896 RepID=A0A6A6IZA2_9PLEO|nr:uncharacterized protein BU26DRAFT_11874 [Trematosphaeria pertusa]KAF2255921.1 hypothetical protein BU26DRAFT_11874 [Trematosphaeria pertusa]